MKKVIRYTGTVSRKNFCVFTIASIVIKQIEKSKHFLKSSLQMLIQLNQKNNKKKKKTVRLVITKKNQTLRVIP